MEIKINVGNRWDGKERFLAERIASEEKDQG